MCFTSSIMLTRVLARILDLGRVSNDQGVHISITLNSQLNSQFYSSTRQQQTMPVVVLCFATKYKASKRSYCALTLEYLSYFSTSWGYLKPF